MYLLSSRYRQIIIHLIQDCATEKEITPLLQFLASFTELESELAEEVSGWEVMVK